jgi:hypothetical protein
VQLCGVDVKLVDNGGTSISPVEAISFLDLQQNFDFSTDCGHYNLICWLMLLSLGLATRFIGYAVMAFSPHK